MTDYAFNLGDRVQDCNGCLGTITHRESQPFLRYWVSWDSGSRSINPEATLLKWMQIDRPENDV